MEIAGCCALLEDDFQLSDKAWDALPGTMEHAVKLSALWKAAQKVLDRVVSGGGGWIGSLGFGATG